MQLVMMIHTTPWGIAVRWETGVALLFAPGIAHITLCGRFLREVPIGLA